MSLLAGIVPSERWGIGEVAPKGWKLYFKGGWGYGTGLLDHQVALLVRGCARVSIAVLTMYDGSHPYGKADAQGHLRTAAPRPADSEEEIARSGRPDSNRGPQAPKACALTRLRYAPRVARRV